MLNRLLAICGWAAFSLRRGLAALPLIGRADRALATGCVVLLLIGAVAPIGLALADPQPADVDVRHVAAGAPAGADGWVRLGGRIVPLAESPIAGAVGSYGLLIDPARPLDAIAVSGGSLEPAEHAVVTGHLVAVGGVTLPDRLPIEATVAGTPPNVVSDRVLELDAAFKPERHFAWYVVAPLALMAGVLGIGLRSGYPIFRRSRVIDVISRPLAPGERVPVAVTGRLGERTIPGHDPVEGLIVPGRGPRGGILTLQLLSPDGRYPPPVALWSGWTGGRTGYLHTIGERLPALAMHTDRVNLMLIFARPGERDRVAAQIAIER